MARFVIADDSRPQRGWLRSALQSAGHVVVGEATNGQEAIDLCRQHKPDCITLDISMPFLTGAEAAPVLLAEKCVGKVFVLTLNTQEQLVKPLRDMGCTILSKPLASKERFLMLLGL